MPDAESSSSCSPISAKASASASCCVSEPGRARYSEGGGCLFDADVNGKAVGRADNGENPQYPFVRRGEHQVAPGVPGVLAAACQRGQATAVNELKSRQVHDDPRLAPCDSHEGSRYVRGVDNVKLPVQRDDDTASAVAGTRVHAEHKPAFLHRSRAGSRPSG